MAHNDTPKAEICELFEQEWGQALTMSACSNRLFRVRKKHGIEIRNPKQWTQAEDSFLLSNHSHMLAKDIAEKLGRTLGAVHTRIGFHFATGELTEHKKRERAK